MIWVRLFFTGLVGNGSDHLTTRRFGLGCGIGSGQRLELADRPRRCERGVAMEPTQRLDAQVSVDQHEPIGVADHYHRHLLPDLGHRADQPPALLAVVNPQVAVPELELVEIHFHAVNLHLSGDRRRLVLRGHPQPTRANS